MDEDYEDYRDKLLVERLEPVVRALLARRRVARGAELVFINRQLEGLARDEVVDGLIGYWDHGWDCRH